jgi:hypothetical protein
VKVFGANLIQNLWAVYTCAIFLTMADVAEDIKAEAVEVWTKAFFLPSLA